MARVRACARRIPPLRSRCKSVNASKRHGTQGEKLDLALLVDGLQAEREQGITIDVAYRFPRHVDWP
jgi:sulfate adenylyltransferase subunit 1 (EFTu-like GTPase family)